MMIFAVGNCAANKWDYYKYNMFSYEVQDFNKNKSHFELLAKNLYSYFEEELKNNDQLQYIKVEQADLTEEEKESLKYVVAAIAHTYNDEFYMIVHLNRVTFKMRDYAVIWSRNGRKPDFLFTPDEEKEFFSKRILFYSFNWYQCIYKERPYG